MNRSHLNFFLFFLLLQSFSVLSDNLNLQMINQDDSIVTSVDFVATIGDSHLELTDVSFGEGSDYDEFWGEGSQLKMQIYNTTNGQVIMTETVDFSSGSWLTYILVSGGSKIYTYTDSDFPQLNTTHGAFRILNLTPNQATVLVNQVSLTQVPSQSESYYWEANAGSYNLTVTSSAGNVIETLELELNALQTVIFNTFQETYVLSVIDDLFEPLDNCLLYAVNTAVDTTVNIWILDIETENLTYLSSTQSIELMTGVNYEIFVSNETTKPIEPTTTYKCNPIAALDSLNIFGNPEYGIPITANVVDTFSSVPTPNLMNVRAVLASPSSTLSLVQVIINNSDLGSFTYTSVTPYVSVSSLPVNITLVTQSTRKRAIADGKEEVVKFVRSGHDLTIRSTSASTTYTFTAYSLDFASDYSAYVVGLPEQEPDEVAPLELYTVLELQAQTPVEKVPVTTTTTTTEEDDGDDDSDSLSAGAIVGIVIGCAAFVVFILASVRYFIMNRRNYRTVF